MDTKTLAVTLILIASTLALLAWLVAWGRKDRALTLWAGGLTSGAVGFLCLLLQGPQSLPLFNLPGNALLVGYNLSLAWGLRIFLGHPPAWPVRFWAYLGLWLGLQVVFLFVVPSYSGRVMVTSSVLALFVAEFLAVLLTGGAQVPGRLKLFLGAVSCLYIGFHLFRIVAVPFSVAGSVLADSLVTVPTFVVSQLTGICWAGGLLLLDSQRLQARVLAGAEELQRLNLLKDRVLAMAGHDLRGPLGNLQTIWTEVGDHVRAGRLPGMDPRLPDLVDQSLTGTQVLLENLMSFAASPGVGAKVPTDLAGEVRAALDLWTVTARNKGIGLRTGNLEPAEVRTVPGAVGAVLRNLVGNAVKFTPSGGTVTVGLRRSEEGGLFLEVEDDGIGIDPGAVRDNTFQKTSRTGTAGERGSGFGLVLVRELVAGWEGTLEFLPGRERGTLVRVGFPG